MMNLPNQSTIAHNHSDVRRLCRLGALKPNEQDLYWVNTDATRDRRSSLVRSLCNALDDAQGEDVQLLVYGHGGAGKSTELIRLEREIGDRYFVVRFSVRDELNPTHVVPEDLPVIIAERVLATAVKSGVEITSRNLDLIYDWFATTTKTVKEAKDSGLTIGAEAGIGSKNPILSLLASLKSEIKFSTNRETNKIVELRKRKGELVGFVNLLLNEVRQALPTNQTLLIIIEDLDKLDIAAARTVFVENVNLLVDLAASIIYTVPIFTFHSPDAGAMKTAFHNRHFRLPMIKVLEADGTTRASGFDVVKEIVRKRVPSSLLPEDALDLVVAKTGGVLQHLFQVIISSASMTDFGTPTEPISLDRIEYGLRRKRQEFQDEIAIPYGGVPGFDDLKVEALYERLVEHAQKQKEGYKPPPDGINQILLRCCALVEYNGVGWCGVHPLVREILQDQCRI